jgi:hypothetical protein
MFIVLIYQAMEMLDSLCPIPKCLYYSSTLPSVFVNGTPRVLIAKTEKQPITRAGGDTFKCPTFLPHV